MKNIVMFFAMASLCCSAHAHAQTLEPLEASSGAYTDASIDHFLKKHDKDGNGKFEKSEDATQWKRNRRLDKNRDGALDREDLRGVLKYVDSPGKQLRNVCFKRVGTRKIFLDFYFPDVDESEKKPVVIYTHGGGWGAGSKHGAGNASFNVVHRALLKQGFCVASVGYRLVPRTGETAMRDCVIDSKDALRFISAYRKELGIDPNQIYTFGDSAGGHLAQMLLLAPPESLQGDPELAKHSYKTVAGVSWYGPCDFEDEQLFNHDDRKKFRDRFGPRILGKDSKPEDKLKLYREVSPINYLTDESPPLLMIQGNKDTTIPVKHAYHMQEKAEGLKAPVEILIVKNAGHNWRKVDANIVPTRDEIVQKTIQFFVAHQKSLTNTNESSLVPKACYPKFSWDTTPMYFMFGDTHRVLTSDEVVSIAARTDFLCIEKSHGRKELGSAELGAKHESAAFKKIKPDAKVLFYFNAAYAWPFTSYNQAFTRNKIDAHPELKKFLLVDPETGQLAHRRNIFLFDVLNPEFRQWWVDTVAKGVAESGCDGVFIDQMHGFVWLRKAKSKEVQQAMGDMMGALKQKMGPDKILIGNNCHQTLAKHVFPAIDGSMFEHFNNKSLSKESLLQDWKGMSRIAKAGKISIFRIGVERDHSLSQQTDQPTSRRERSKQMAALAKERVEYYLACYLIGAQPYSYFQYGWGFALSSGALQDYPALNKPLGSPLGRYQRTTPQGWEFTREFERASVWVDTESKTAKIKWKN